jgi:hypothetical protein
VIPEDPFQVLGLDETATKDDLRQARRRLARLCHPDLGGDPESMTAINAAFDSALAIVHAAAEAPPTDRSPATRGPNTTEPGSERAARRRVRPRPTRTYEHDPASFVVHCLPVDAFEALSVAVSWYGEVIDDDPPYRLVAVLGEPSPCWCRLDLVPDAGATTVDLTIAAYEIGHGAPTAEEIRDLLVGAVNSQSDQR